MISDIAYHCGLVRRINIDRILIRHPHLLLEVDFSLVIALLSILDLSVPLVYQMVAGRDMVVSIVFNALLSILSVEIVFNEQFFKEFILHRHLFLAGEEAHISISIFYLQRPGMIPDVCHREPRLWVRIQNSSYQIFTLAREELWKGIFSAHNFLVKV